MFVDGGKEDLLVPGIDVDEQEVARIYSEFEFGNNLEALNRAQKWLDENSGADNLSAYSVTNLMMRAARLLSKDDIAVNAAEQQLRIVQSSPSSSLQTLRAREFDLAVMKLPKLKAQPGGVLIEAKTTVHGATSIPVSIGGEEIDAVIDTGAEFSAIPSDLAVKFGFKIIEGLKVPYQPIFAKPYNASVAIAPTMHIGDLQVDNAKFILADANKDNLRNSHFVLGLQFIEQFGRLAFLDHGASVALGDAAPDVSCLGGSGQLFRHNDGIGLSVALDGNLAPAHYDTAFGESAVHVAPLSFYAPDRRIRKFPQGPGKIGLSPLVVGQFREFEFEMDGKPVKERRVLVFRSRDASRKLDFPLIVGGITTRRFDVIALDFTTMRYAAVKVRDARTGACLAAPSKRAQKD